MRLSLSLSQMFKPVRVLATIVLIVSIVLVFISAFVLGNDVSVLFSFKLSKTRVLTSVG